MVLIIGGLGSAVREVLGENRSCFMQRVGIMDTFGESAKNMEDLFKKYRLTSEEIVRGAKRVVDKKNRKLCLRGP